MQRRRRGKEVMTEELGEGLGLKGDVASQHLEQDAAEGILIGATVDGFSLGLLRGQVVRRAKELPGLGAGMRGERCVGFGQGVGGVRGCCGLGAVGCRRLGQGIDRGLCAG